MSTARCPACHAPVDALLAPAPVVVRDRVVMCCSAACARAVREEALAPTSAQEAESQRGAVVDTAPAPSPAAAEATAPEKEPPLPEGEVTAIPATTRARELPRPWRTRLRSWPLAAALLAAGVLLLVLAFYLVLEYTTAAPATVAGQRGPSPASGREARDARPDPARAAPAPRAARGSPAASDAGSRTILALRQRSWRALEGFLGSEVVRFRLTAADVLSEQGHPRALETLQKALTAELWTTRQLAAESLARLGHLEGLSTLKDSLGSARKPVKWGAAFSLARCGDASGVPLIKQLAYFQKFRMTAYEALAGLGDPGGKRFLQRVLKGKDPPYERLRAAVALGRAGDRSGLPLLLARLREPGMHLGVALALQKLGSPEAQAALRRALDHAALRVEAARALRSYGDVSGVTEMSRTLESPSPEAQLTAAASIVILTAQARAEAR